MTVDRKAANLMKPQCSAAKPTLLTFLVNIILPDENMPCLWLLIPLCQDYLKDLPDKICQHYLKDLPDEICQLHCVLQTMGLPPIPEDTCRSSPFII